ncbi:MAG: zinc-ribbon domain-containing protein [Candidatus Lokiarchaeota archaeon]|nr:zinc-ribbon domain-containing protein [Candidatus Lokiarchaeota archaeon]
MGLKRVICSGCLGMLCLIPMAWISFAALDLTGSVTGGLITGLNELLASIPAIGGVLSIIGGAFIGLFLIFLFPIHWALMYRPDDVMLLISLVLPWVLCCSITSAIFAHSPRGGLHTSLAIGIGYVIPMILIYFAIPALINSIAGGMGSFGTGIIDGLSTGLTDLPYLAAVSTAILEGCLVGAFFGAFVGSLKYKPDEEVGKSVKSTGTTKSEPKLDTADDFCTNCGAKLVSGDEFCTNCGQKV